MSDRPPRDPALATPGREGAATTGPAGRDHPWHEPLYDAPQRPHTNSEMLAPAFAFLGGAGAWGLHLGVVYAISEVACKTDRLSGAILGLGAADAFGIAATVVAGLTAMAALVVALTLAPLTTDPMDRAGDPERPGRERYLAFAGLIMNVLFTLSIINQGLPFMFLQACTT